MLKKIYRLKSSYRFQKTLSGQKMAGFSACLVFVSILPVRYINPNPKLRTASSPSIQVGFIVSKKVHKRANRRNLARRWLREIIRKEWLDPLNAFLKTAQFPPSRQVSIVFVAKTSILSMTYAQVQSEINRAFPKVLHSIESQLHARIGSA
jgi:ribonuclease P protein component